MCTRRRFFCQYPALLAEEVCCLFLFVYKSYMHIFEKCITGENILLVNIHLFLAEVYCLFFISCENVCKWRRYFLVNIQLILAEVHCLFGSVYMSCENVCKMRRLFLSIFSSF